MMQILKIGGSVITYKDQYFSPNLDNINRLTQEIKESKTNNLILIHGAGSFGHPVAKKHSISEGFQNKDQLIGLSKTHQSMTRLNQIIIDRLLEAGVPAFSISASSMMLTQCRRIIEIDLKIIHRLLNMGLVPVMFGDAVLDTEQGFAILSGDQLIVKLAMELKAERIIFGSDVDGIFTSNPKNNKDAKLITKLSFSNMNAKVSNATYTDVTGGMMGKLTEAKEAVKAGTEVIFLNATVKDRVKTALKGEKVIGTILTL
jgi:isopentenyl phosphate kinase